MTDDNKKTNDITDGQTTGFFGYENLKSLLVMIVIIFALRWSVASPYHVPTASMEPTIKVGDRLLAFKLAYGFKIPFFDSSLFSWAEVKKGDIIVFIYPEDISQDFVKRVVAVGGDTIEVREDILYINGTMEPRASKEDARQILDDIHDTKELKLLYEEDLAGVKHWTMQNIPSARPLGKTNYPQDGSGPFLVPEDAVFCMGDNRDNSKDSRIWGIVPKDYIRGKALFVIWSAFTAPDPDGFTFRFSRFGHWLK
jgi:signal peptidase I